MPSSPREWLSLRGDIDAAISLVLVIAAPLVAYLGCRYQRWRARQTTRSLIAEIALTERLTKSPSARMELMQERVFWLFAVLGMWMMW